MAGQSGTLGLAAGASVIAAALLQYGRVAPIGPVLALALYFIVWWVSLFVVLPFGVQTQSDTGNIVQGTSAGAPINPRLGRVVAWTTILASTVFAVVLMALRFKIVPLE